MSDPSAATAQGTRIPDGCWFRAPRRAGDYGAMNTSEGRRWFNRPPNAEPDDPDCVLNEDHVVVEHGDGTITVHASILNRVIDSASIGGAGPISTRGPRPWHGHLERGIWSTA